MEPNNIKKDTVRILEQGNTHMHPHPLSRQPAILAYHHRELAILANL
jgi:hypothetical protein